MNEKRKQNTKSMVLAAVFVAITAILSQIAIPSPFNVPLTMQTFAVALCGYVLGTKWASASIVTYVLLGTVGVPVFAGFKGGVGTLFGVTGGFIFGFIAFAIICGLTEKVNNHILSVLIGIVGLAICHVLGVIQFSYVYGSKLWASALMVSIPYLIKDVISVILAYLASLYIIKLTKKI